VRKLSKKSKKEGKVIPPKVKDALWRAGIYSNMLIFLFEWMPARPWRIYDLRGHDLNLSFFDSLDS